MMNNAGQMIKAAEDLLVCNNGYRNHPTQTKQENIFGTKTWIDNIATILDQRSLEIVNKVNLTKCIIQNQTIMDYAAIFLNNHKDKAKKLE